MPCLFVWIRNAIVTGAVLQGVLAVAEACGMQNLLKAAGVEYEVTLWVQLHCST